MSSYLDGIAVQLVPQPPGTPTVLGGFVDDVRHAYRVGRWIALGGLVVGVGMIGFATYKMIRGVGGGAARGLVEGARGGSHA